MADHKFRRGILMRSLLSRAIFSLGLIVGFGGVASADIISFSLDTGNPGLLAGGPPPYATVTINRTSATTATITFDALTSGATLQYLFGSDGAVGVNVAGAFSLGSMSCTAFFGSCGALSSGGAGNEDGFGKFNLTINSFDGLTHSSTEIVFDITATGTNTWADAAHVLTANAGGAIAAAHIFVYNGTCGSGTAPSCVTGFAAGSGGGGPPVIIPEPQTLALLGLGLLVLGIARRRQIG